MNEGLPIDLNYVVAAVMICSTMIGIGMKLGKIGFGIIDRIGRLEAKVDVLITDMRNNDARMNRQDERMDRLEERIARLENPHKGEGS